jgi:hypothetical protein
VLIVVKNVKSHSNPIPADQSIAEIVGRREDDREDLDIRFINCSNGSLIHRLNFLKDFFYFSLQTPQNSSPSLQPQNPRFRVKLRYSTLNTELEISKHPSDLENSPPFMVHKQANSVKFLYFTIFLSMFLMQQLIK